MSTVGLFQDDNRIVIEVGDDGIGFNTEALGKDSTKGGFGLFSIKERLEYMGGRVFNGLGQGSRDSDRPDRAHGNERETKARPCAFCRLMPCAACINSFLFNLLLIYCYQTAN